VHIEKMGRVRVVAVCLLGVGLAATQVRPSRAGQAVEPAPGDAWADQLAAEQATEAGFGKQFPLYGVAFHVLAQVVAEPSEHAEVIGYLRRGARIRASAPRAGRGCDRSWHELSTGGFVCAGRGFALGAHPEDFAGAPAAPAVFEALPYRYAKNVLASAVQYWRVPTRDEQVAVAKLLAPLPLPPPSPTPLKQAAKAQAATPATDAGVPDAPKLPEYARMAMEPGFYVSVDAQQDADDRGFLRTVRGAYVEQRALLDVSIGRAPGVVLYGASSLPLGIALRTNTRVMERDPLSGTLRVAGTLERFSVVLLTGARVEHDGQHYLLTRAGLLVPEAALRVVERSERPPLVPRHARFIHVSLAQQSLVAYDGQRPVFATLVSTGKEGFETPQGVFRILAKHVTATMDGTAGSDETYSIEDVPWTMYFQGSYALHAAFWHDRFGNVRSHGCVNLAPADARWLFQWATPVLPSGWHGVVASHDNPGTWLAVD
jgi:hypothetical protein